LEFLVVGLNHRTAPLEVREKITLNSEQLPSALSNMAAYGVPGVILSTCNRSEFYALDLEDGSGSPAEWGKGEKRIKEFLVDYFQIRLVDVERYLYLHRGSECVSHLFRVAASLDSMMLGEDQIIGQVREAFDTAVRSETVTGPLFHLFQQALRVGRKVRRESGIGQNAMSISRACVELAEGDLGDLSGLSAMVLGTGDAGSLAAKGLRSSGVSDITVVNRTHHRAVALAKTLSGQAVPLPEMPQALREIDLVVACTGSPEYILDADLVSNVMASRPDRPMFLIDIAVPRDIDPAAGLVDNVFLHDVDDLDRVSEARRLESANEAQQAEGLISKETEGFLQWRLAQEALPTVIALRDKADAIRAQELKKTLRKMNPALSPEDTAALEAMTQAIVKKILHGPTMYLKEHRNPSDLRTAREIFKLGGNE
jgi:glutamyl-tRNA reductase